ncbi:uncharacterized protein BJX67DRAFT_389505 [Aspergillus lucknowensis]|uniref:General substrate transporter n=1 Tax=Aspergillus lucknowensis TaxID=176173 RepID=A0ABR4LLB3_9EURO
MIIGAILLATSETVAQLIVRRTITGIENGMNSSTAPVYQSECAPARYRGALLTLQGTMDYGMSFTESSFQWRFPPAFQAVYAICLILQLIGFPETPRRLVHRDYHEEARKVIATIEKKPANDAEVVRTIVDLQVGLEELVMFQTTMGKGRDLSIILGGAIQCTYLVGSATPLFYGIGWLPVPWFCPSEISTTRTRTRMQTIASGWNWMAACAVVKMTPLAFDNIGWRAFIIFAVLNAVFIPMDISFLFAKRGFTGGVFTSKCGRTITPGQHAEQTDVNRQVEGMEQEGPSTAGG